MQLRAAVRERRTNKYWRHWANLPTINFHSMRRLTDVLIGADLTTVMDTGPKRRTNFLFLFCIGFRIIRGDRRQWRTGLLWAPRRRSPGERRLGFPVSERWMGSPNRRFGQFEVWADQNWLVDEKQRHRWGQQLSCLCLKFWNVKFCQSQSHVAFLAS